VEAGGEEGAVKTVYGGYAAEHHGHKSVDECSMNNELIPFAETPGISPQSFILLYLVLLSYFIPLRILEA